MFGWSRRVAYALLALVATYAVWRLSVFVAVDVVLERAETAIVERSQASRSLVRGVLLALSPLFIWALTESLSLPKWGGYKSSRRRRQLAKVLLLLSLAAYTLTLYLISRDKFFTASGEAQKWCADNPDGIRCYDQPGVDPETGIKLEPVTSAQVLAWRRAELGQQPRRLSIEVIDTYDFVDTLRPNRPLVWYGLDRKSGIELFDGPGFHPVTGAALQPVSLEIIERYENQLRRKKAAEAERRADEARELDRETTAREEAEVIARQAEEALRRQAMIQHYVNRLAVSVAPQVVVVDSAGKLDAAAAQQVASAIGAGTDLFRPSFLADGLFAEALAGDSERLRLLELDSNGPIYLLQKRSAVEITNRQQGLHKARTSLEGRRYAPENGYSSVILQVDAEGAAFTREEAVRRSERAALEHLLQRLEQR